MDKSRTEYKASVLAVMGDKELIIGGHEKLLELEEHGQKVNCK